MLTRSDESEKPCFTPYLEEMLSAFHYDYVSYEFVIHGPNKIRNEKGDGITGTTEI